MYGQAQRVWRIKIQERKPNTKCYTLFGAGKFSYAKSQAGCISKGFLTEIINRK